MLAPFLSATRSVTHIRLTLIDPFPNCSRVGKLQSPLLVLHGKKDRVIPFSQGKKLYELATVPKRFVEVDDAGHNDLIDSIGYVKFRKLILEFVASASDSP